MLSSESTFWICLGKCAQWLLEIQDSRNRLSEWGVVRSMTYFVRNRLQLLSSWRATKHVSIRRDAICERCTTKRDSRCCICPFLILGCQQETTWNRQFNKRLPTRKQGTISS